MEVNGTGQAGLSQLEDDWPDWRFRNVCDPALLLVHSPASRSAAVLGALCPFWPSLALGHLCVSLP